MGPDLVSGPIHHECLEIPGASPGLLLLHEGLGSVSMWRDFPHALARATGRRTVAYSRLGFGRSSPRTKPYGPRFMHEEAEEILPALRRELAMPEVVLVGHSTGASMALLHAASEPAAVRGVVAMAPLVEIEGSNLASIEAAREHYRTTDWRDNLARHHAHPVDAVFASWNDTWLDPAFREWTITAELAQVRCPILAILGDDDPYSTPAQLEALARSATNARSLETLRLPGCGHAPHREAREEVLAAIARFVAAVAPA